MEGLQLFSTKRGQQPVTNCRMLTCRHGFAFASGFLQVQALKEGVGRKYLQVLGVVRTQATQHKPAGKDLLYQLCLSR